MLQWASVKYGCTLQQNISARPRIVLNWLLMAEMAKTKVTPWVKHPEHTQYFVSTVKEALDAFEEQIRFPDEEVRSRAYEKFLQAY